MIIKLIMVLRPYDLTFLKQLVIFKSGKYFKIDSKPGFIIKVEKDDISSCADLSPLAHISTETYKDVQNDCKKIDTIQIFKDLDRYLQSEDSKNLFLKEKFLDFDFSVYTKYPSLQHALSCLFSDYYRQKFKIKILGNVYYHGLILNSLNWGSEDEAIKKVLSFEQQGFEKVKIKIGSSSTSEASLELENKFLKNVLSKTQRIKLRLDANRKFNLIDYKILLKNLDLSRIDYIEEPVSKNIELLDFNTTTKVPLAIDENIRLMKDVRIEGVKAVVIKPTLIGDFHAIKKILVNCRKREIYPIISSSYESQLGIYQLAQLAHELNPQESHGLDTFDCYLENLVDLPIQNNVISLKENIELKGPLYV